MKKFYSNGKLLITGEYLVLDGAISLALPTKFGQSLEVFANTSKSLVWKSYNLDGCWFRAEFSLDAFSIQSQDNPKVAETLQKILQTAKILQPKFLEAATGMEVTTYLNFPNEWGLGTSSTLINNIAQWAKVNPYELLELSFGGSGYDIACAQNNTAITYQRNRIYPKVNSINFVPKFKEQLFFVYLNQKQNSKEGIQKYRSIPLDKLEVIAKINKLTQAVINADTLKPFEELLTVHETVISNILEIQPVKAKLFADYKGAVKSLGAWGGDFVLVTGKEAYVKTYFTNKGYQTILSYDEMILTN